MKAGAATAITEPRSATPTASSTGVKRRTPHSSGSSLVIAPICAVNDSSGATVMA
jgi:hypothetical protein